ncbi:unnamed protein product [Allacma fusca]|uniref:Secreted protein n=1 Tax=Allacma fusca TaxID=39272 RepID=A0A8J2NJE4_9HEXA|nr:unnamed protein product [Allacma fusca]
MSVLFGVLSFRVFVFYISEVELSASNYYFLEGCKTNSMHRCLIQECNAGWPSSKPQPALNRSSYKG